MMVRQEGAEVVGASIVLVPGFWLGAWAWEAVVQRLQSRGHDAMAVTLPGLEATSADRTSITLDDHVDAICAAVDSTGRPTVLVVHSGAGVSGYAATDRIANLITSMVYVDSGPATAAVDPDFDEPELALPSWEELEAQGSSLTGLSDEQLETFRRRAVPEPGGAVREAPLLTNDARLDVPTTVICSSMSSQQIRDAVAAGFPLVAGLAQLRFVDYVDLPTGHWPMWSRPDDLAEAISRISERSSPDSGPRPTG